ncbi:hypothetical protein PSPO01_16049 [Paraphaeosphaeria sporulosa]
MIREFTSGRMPERRLVPKTGS